MPDLLAYALLFTAVGAFFIFSHLMIGKLVRPNRPDAEKKTIYECGEPTIGSAWIQFDLRYYVVALLFVIFDVEVAFFFPWAITFGKANDLANPDLTVEQRKDLSRQVSPASLPLTEPGATRIVTANEASEFAWIAMLDILVFFGVLMVGFAYLWRRGDINWVRSTAAEAAAAPPAAPELPLGTAEELVGSGQH